MQSFNHTELEARQIAYNQAACDDSRKVRVYVRHLDGNRMAVSTVKPDPAYILTEYRRSSIGAGGKVHARNYHKCAPQNWFIATA